MSAQPASVPLVLEARASDRALVAVASRRWLLVVWAGIAGWSTGLYALVRSNYLHFGVASPFDLGDMVQAVWSTTQGRPLEMSTLNVDVSRLAYHVDPILVLLAPLWMVWPSPLALAAAQLVACALGALPVFWLGRHHLHSEKAAALMALAYLAYPWLAWTASDAMHPVTLAIPLFVYAIWFLETGKLGRFALCAVLIVATGELMGLTVAALGIWYAVARGRRAAGVVTAGLGVAWSVVAVKLVVPAFLGHQSIYYAQYDAVGGSPGGVVRTLFADPGTVASKLFSDDNLLDWGWLALPLLGLFALAPLLALVAVPAALENGLSSEVVQSQPIWHYGAGVIPFLVVGSVLGLARLSPGVRVRGAGVVLGLSSALLVLVGPFPGTPLRDTVWQLRQPDATHARAVRAALALVPQDASITANGYLHAQLAARRHLYTFPFVERSSWALLDTRPARPLSTGARAFWTRSRSDRRWSKVFGEDGVFLFRRVSRT